MVKVSKTLRRRMKRSGQSWGRIGGQGALTIRSLIKSGQFDRAREILKRQITTSSMCQPQ